MSIRLEPEEEEQEEGAPAWTVQFADMMSLLLVFFILLLSFSEIDAVKYRALSDSFRQAFGKTDQVKDMFNDPQATAQLISEESGAHNDAILDELRSIIPQSYPGALPDRDNGKGYLVRIPGRLLFDTGKDELKPGMKPKLRLMAQLLMRRPDVVLRVDGHTDDVPINTSRFKSNWELSAGRALAVVHFMIDECGLSPRRISGEAFGESRPIVPNDTPEHRELNRRVEFRFVQGDEETYDETSQPATSADSEDAN
jgi:chemotaxis protein MotB